MLDYALGEGMKPEVNDNVYRVAFESAKTELGEISATFEQLRLRKERIEKLVTVLKPLVGVEEQAGPSVRECRRALRRSESRRWRRFKRRDASAGPISAPH